MRKPYRWRRGPLPEIEDDLIKSRPEWAAKIGEIASHWNVLEASTWGLFMVLQAGEDEVGLILYYDVLKDPKRQAREKIFTAIGEARGVPEQLMARILDLWDDVQAVEGCRNEVMHAIWASIKGHPNSIFAMKNRLEWIRNANAALTCAIARVQGKSNFIVPNDLPTIYEFYEYQLTDLQEIIDDLLDLNGKANEIHAELLHIRMTQAPAIPPWQKAESIIRHLDRENESRRSVASKRPPKRPPKPRPRRRE